MMKHGVLAVDFSEAWDRARDHLPALVERLGIQRLTLVNVLEPQLREARKQELRGLRSRQLQELAPTLAQAYGIEVDHRLEHGFVASTVLKVATEVGADLVITSNRSHSRARELFLGNVALNLARMCRLPLLILPVDSPVPALEGPILLGTDGSEAARGAEALFCALATGDVPAQVLWVDSGAGQDVGAEAPALAELAERGGDIRPVTLEGDPAYLITEVAERENAGLIIVGKRGRTPLPDLPLGSTAEAVCRLARTPVMLVPARWKAR